MTYEETILHLFKTFEHARAHIECIRAFPFHEAMKLTAECEEWIQKRVDEETAEEFHSKAYGVLAQIMQVQNRSIPARCVKLESGMWELQILVLEQWTRMKREFSQEQIESMGFEIR